jgi:hypothetical protein
LQVDIKREICGDALRCFQVNRGNFAMDGWVVTVRPPPKRA